MLNDQMTQAVVRGEDGLIKVRVEVYRNPRTKKLLLLHPRGAFVGRLIKLCDHEWISGEDGALSLHIFRDEDGSIYTKETYDPGLPDFLHDEQRGRTVAPEVSST